MERSLLPSLGGSIGTNLEPPLYRAPIAGGKDDGVERILPAVGELDNVPMHALQACWYNLEID